jgi:hypothetical protein
MAEEFGESLPSPEKPSGHKTRDIFERSAVDLQIAFGMATATAGPKEHRVPVLAVREAGFGEGDDAGTVATALQPDLIADMEAWPTWLRHRLLHGKDHRARHTWPMRR